MDKVPSGKPKYRAVVFDLDQTMIDSSAAEPLRRAGGQWPRVYAMIPKLPVYAGIPDILEWLEKAEIPVGIATTSPESYCTRIVEHHGWNISAKSCYHCTKPYHKPHPAPIQKVAERLGVDPAHVVSIGDDPKDIKASRRVWTLPRKTRTTSARR
jgi:phosphoglycolate phosphatase-like HAD superfamily hydrolase